MMVTIDDETLARAVLTFCLDSADAMMCALVKGTGSAARALQLLADSGPGSHATAALVGDAPSTPAEWLRSMARWWHGSIVWHRCPARIRTHCETGSQQTARSGSSPRITPVGPAN